MGMRVLCPWFAGAFQWVPSRELGGKVNRTPTGVGAVAAEITPRCQDWGYPDYRTDLAIFLRQSEQDGCPSLVHRGQRLVVLLVVLVGKSIGCGVVFAWFQRIDLHLGQTFGGASRLAIQEWRQRWQVSSIDLLIRIGKIRSQGEVMAKSWVSVQCSEEDKERWRRKANEGNQGFAAWCREMIERGSWIAASAGEPTGILGSVVCSRCAVFGLLRCGHGAE